MPPPNTPDGSPPSLSPLRITVPPNTPFNHGSPVRSRRNTQRRTGQSIDEIAEDGLDLRSLKYVSDVDENLLCPICHAALVEPITTKCDHTFCRECMKRSWNSSKTCPVDRLPLSFPEDISPSPRIVLNQLDALKVGCPWCEDTLPRSMLRNHLSRYCNGVLVRCPDETCQSMVPRKDEGKGCLHHDTTCPDCDGHFQEIELDSHREFECEKREASCEHCAESILRCKQSEHLKVCLEVTTLCKWAKYGCQHEALRKDLDSHTVECRFTAVGQMADMLQLEIATLREQVHTLTEKDKNQERRIKFLETHPHFSFSDISSQTVSRLPDSLPDSSPAEFPESRDQYLLSLLESQESKVDQLSLGMTELEAKQTMMLFNETIPIKEQLSELRSAQGVIGMHVRWLMNFRMQERRPGPGASGGSDSGGPGNDGHRRLSDTMRDVITKL